MSANNPNRAAQAGQNASVGSDPDWSEQNPEVSIDWERRNDRIRRIMENREREEALLTQYASQQEENQRLQREVDRNREIIERQV